MLCIHLFYNHAGHQIYLQKQVTHQTSPCGRKWVQCATGGSCADLDLDFSILENWAGYRAISHSLFQAAISQPTGQQITWNSNRRKFLWLFSHQIIDALGGSVFHAVTIHSCTCDRTASWLHYAQLGGNAYFNLPHGAVTLCSVALANWPLNCLGAWKLLLQPVRCQQPPPVSFCCQHSAGSRAQTIKGHSVILRATVLGPAPWQWPPPLW